jgi:TonB family protein
MNHLPEILLSNLFLVFIWGFFELFLRDTRSFHANRFFLLAGSVIAVVLPWLPWQVRIPVHIQPILSLPDAPAEEMMAFDPMPAGDLITIPAGTPINWPLVIYFSVVGLLVLTFLTQTVRMYLWTRRRPITRWDRYRVVELNKQWPAFSFFGTIYFPEPFEPDKRETITILKHERVHARQLHSVDNILLLAIRILFFYNPAVHFLAGRLRLTHEYLADAATAGANKVEYSQTLIHHQFLVPRLLLMHSFNNQSFLKRRLNMLLKNNTSSRAAWLYLLAAPLAAGMIVLSGWSASAQNPERGQKDDMKDRISKEMVKTGFTKTSDTTWTKDGVNVALVENPNLETIATELKQAEENKLAIEAAKKTGISQDIPQDADKKVKACDELPEFNGSRTTGFPKWVESQLRFPEEAVKKGLTGGIVKVKFVVNKQGKVQDVSLYKGIDPLLDNIVMKVVASSPDWKPGKYKGKPVDVPLMLPFMFDLETSDAKTGAESHVGEIGQTFLIVEEMPTFQGGKINDFRNWVQDNIKYPAEAKAAKKQGTVYVSFVIDTLGNPVNINLVRGSDPALDAEAIRVIKSSPAWQPGKQRSRKVNVSFSIPIAFILSENGEMIKPPATQQKPPVKAEYNGQHVFLIVEDMPTFQGGKIEDFRNWVQTNVKYPELAKEKRLSGTEYVTFIVDTTGRVVNPQVIRSVDPILDAEIMRVLCSAPLWQPGKQRGQLVNVSFAIPVKFVLEGPAGEPAQKDTSRTVMQVASTVQGVASRQEVIRGGNTVYVDGIRVKASDKQVFMIVEKMPKFKGGDIKKFVKWAQSNVKYPALAMENSISGTVEVYFIVNKVGQVEDVTVEKSIDPALDEAAINVVKSSPAWTPGQQRGKNVNVSFKIPIKFKLQ